MAKIKAAPAPAPAPTQANAPVAAAPKKKKSRKRLLAFALVAMLAGGGGVTWYALQSGPGTAEAKPAPAIEKPIFLPLDAFTVNLAAETGDHYLQVGIVYQLGDDQATDRMKLYMPVLRNRLLLLLSAKRPSELSTAEGKTRLVEELVVAARQSIPGGTGDKGIVTALLSSFVIQ